MAKVTQGRTIQQGWHLFRNRRTLWQMMRNTISGHYRMSFLTILIMTLCITYVIFPFDLIPDYIPVVGWVDDGIVFYLMLRRLVFETKRYSRFKAMERRSQ